MIQTQCLLPCHFLVILHRSSFHGPGSFLSSFLGLRNPSEWSGKTEDAFSSPHSDDRGTRGSGGGTPTKSGYNNIVNKESSSPGSAETRGDAAGSSASKGSWGSFSLLHGSTGRRSDKHGTHADRGHTPHHKDNHGQSGSESPLTPSTPQEPAEESSPVSPGGRADTPRFGPKKRSLGSLQMSPLLANVCGSNGPSSSQPTVGLFTMPSTDPAAAGGGSGGSGGGETKKGRSRTFDPPSLSAAVTAANLERQIPKNG
jgi:hypothetical protein